MIDYILNSGFSFTDDEHELKLKYYMFNTILHTATLIMLILIVVRLVQENYLQVLIDIIFISFTIFSIFYIKKSKDNIDPAIRIILLSFYILVSLLFINHKLSIVGASFFIVLILPSFYLLGIKEGAIVALISFVSILFLGQFKEDSLTLFESLYIFMPVFLSAVFTFIYEKKVSYMLRLLKQLLKQKDELLQKAYYDELTKLPNRSLFGDRLTQSIAKSKRIKKELAILFIDLDKFKEINDTLGHSVGDGVLCEVSKRFKNTLRETDTVARFGGDEFVCILEELQDTNCVANLTQKIIDNIKIPMIIEDNTITLTCSIGISIYPKDATDITTLLHHADVAMYKAKDSTKDTFRFYEKLV